MTSSINVMRSEYESLSRDLDMERKRAKNPRHGSSGFIELLSRSNRLFDENVAGTDSPQVADFDHRVFSEISADFAQKFQSEVNNDRNDLSINSAMEALSANSGPYLQKMGRGLLAGSTITNFKTMPRLETISARQITRGPRAAAERPTGAPSGILIVNENERESETDRVFREAEEAVIAALMSDSRFETEGVQLYRLVFDKESYVRTMEHFFVVSVMVKEGKMWLSSDDAGLPIVGLIRESRPASDENLTGRQQFNLNFDSRLYNVQRQLYGNLDSLIRRIDYTED